MGGTGTLSYGYINSATTPSIGSFSFTKTGAAGATITFTDLAPSANNYYVAVQDANGCSLVGGSAAVNEPTDLTATPTFTVINPSSVGGTNGSINTSAISGGTGTITYTWVNSAGATVSTSTANANLTTDAITGLGLAAGTYTLTATDANGCTKTYAQQTLIDCFNIEATITHLTQNSLGDGGIDLNTAFENGINYTAYVASWELVGTPNTPMNTSAADGSFGAGNRGELTAIGAGTYIATVTASGTGLTTCFKTYTYTVLEPAAFTITSVTTPKTTSLETVDIICNGDTDASIVLTVSGGTAPYTTEYRLPDVSTAVVNGATTTSTAVILDGNTGYIEEGDLVSGTGVTAGTTVISITDQYNMVLSNSLSLANNTTLTFTSTSTATVNGGITADDDLIVDGNLGTINVGDIVTGIGISGTVTVATVTDQNTLVLSSIQTISNDVVLTFSPGYTAVTGLTVSNLPPSSYLSNTSRSGAASGYAYEVRVKDKNGFYVSNTQYVDIISSNLYWSAPATADGSLTIADAQCSDTADGTASYNAAASIFGGVSIASADIKWYKVVAGVGVEIAAFSGLTSVIGLEEASYYLQLTDALGCVKSSNFAIYAPEAITMDETITDVLCPGENYGEIEVLVGGGVSAYTYVWKRGAEILPSGPDPDDGTIINDISRATVNTAQISSPYTVKNNSGTILVGDTVTGSGISGTVLVSTVSVDQLSIGLTPAVTLADNVVLTFHNKNTTGTIRSNKISVVSTVGGEYTLDITDANGCTATETYTLNVPEAFLFSGTIVTQPLCYGDEISAIDLSLKGGTVTKATVNGATTANTNLVIDGQYGTIVAGSKVTGTGISGSVTVTTVTDQNNLVLSSAQTLSDGVVLSFTRASGGYQYTWKKLTTLPSTYTAVATGQDITGIGDGTYKVEVQDGNGCTADTTILITQPSTSWSLDADVYDATCNAGSTGSITLIPNDNPDGLGGGDPLVLIYAWTKNGVAETNTTKFLTGLAAATYTVTATDANFCVKSASYTLSENPAMAISSSFVDLTCPGVNDATIDISASGGNSTYAYVWTQDGDEVYPTGTLAAADPTALTTLSAGVYQITVTDELTDATNPAPTVSTTVNQATSTGTVFTVASTTGINAGDIVRGTGIYGTVKVTIVNSATQITLSSSQKLYNGTTLTFRANNFKASCQVVESFTITDKAAFAVTPTLVDPKCYEGSDGQISIVVTGGTVGTGYTYQWKKDPTGANTFVGNTATISNLTGGAPAGDEYRLVVTDANNCISPNFDYTLNAPLTAWSLDAAVTDPACNGGSTGSVVLTPNLNPISLSSNHPNTFTYAWTQNGVAYAGAVGASATNLVAANYTVTATDSYGCIKSASYVVSQNPAMLISSTFTDVTCPAGSDGTIDIAPSGGNGSYLTHVWTKDADAFPIPVGSTTTSLVGRAAGFYQVTVADEAITTLSAKVTAKVNQATSTSTVFDIDNLSGTINAGDIVTGDGIMGTVTVALVNSSTRITLSSSQTLADDKTLTFRATNFKVSCSAVKSFTITEPSAFAVSETVVAPVCQDGTDGQITVAVTGGTVGTGYTYQWKKATVYVGNTATISNLSGDNPSGENYDLVVTDGNSCVYTHTPINVSSPTTTYSINASTSITNTVTASATASVLSNVSCHGAADGYLEIKLTATATHPTDYDYAWYAGSTSSGIPFKEGEKNVYALDTGTYTFKVTDYYGCAKESVYTIEQYSPLTLSELLVDNVCGEDVAAGSIKIEANGGNEANYNYQWYKDGDAFATTAKISSLTAGVYKIIATDNQGCESTESYEISYVTPLSLDSSLVHNICKDSIIGQIDITLAGGNAPYTIAWDKAGVFIDDTEDLAGLAAGTYSLTVIDNLNCAPLTQDFVVTEPATAYNIGVTGIDVSCFEAKDGTIDINLVQNAGHPGYDISWTKDGELFNSEKESLTGLNGGLYTVTIVDDYGCLRTDNITLTQPDDIDLNPVIDTLECYNATNAIITLDPKGGAGLYPSIIWKYNGVITPDVAFEATDLASGDYNILITDLNSCFKDSTIVISNPANMAVTADITNVLCKNETTGVISIEMVNGKAPYTYAWFDSGSIYNTTTIIDSLAMGDYTLAVKDAYNCLSDTFTLEVTEPNNVYNILGDIDRVSCRDYTDGQIFISVENLGESTDFSYVWSKGGIPFLEDVNDLIDMPPGSYSLAVTDNFGCTRTGDFVLENPDSLLYTVDKTDIRCNGDQTGIIALAATGGWGNYTYEWEKNLEVFPINKSFATKLPAGDYIISITDEAQCTVLAPVSLTAPDPILITTEITDNTCSSPADGAILATVSGGIPGYVYNWYTRGTPYAQTLDIVDVPGGIYELIITDSILCEVSSGSLQVIAPEPISMNILSAKNNLCTTTSNGELFVQGTGGTFPYTYSLDGKDPNTDNQLTGLSEGAHEIVITDDHLCQFDSLVIVDTDYLIAADFRWEYDFAHIDWPINFYEESLGPDIVSWAWDLGNGEVVDDSNAELTYESAGAYPISLKVTNLVGCESVKEDILLIEQGFKIVMPSAFTANNDGLNDFYRPSLENIIEIKLKIYDKYGSLVFASDNLDAEWAGDFNGVDLPQDTYLYQIDYVAQSGVSRSKNGKFAMLR